MRLRDLAPIIQWNCRGLKFNLIDLITGPSSSPSCFFFIFKKLIWKSYTITLKIDYVYSTYVDEDERPAVDFFIIYSDYLHLLC